MSEQLDLVAPSRTALLSPCEVYRYELRRTWGPGWLALFCGANPSTADHKIDDHTIRKETGFAKRWGCDGLIKVNINPHRSTDPDGVPELFEPLAWRANADICFRALLESRVTIVVVGWGDCLRRNPTTEIAIRGFHDAVETARRIRDVQCFGLTKHGNPKHPLTLSYATPLVPFEFAKGGA